MTSSATGSPKQRRARGLCLAVLLAAAQGSAWLHAAVVSHITCLEHGDAIHASSGSPAHRDVSEPIAARHGDESLVDRVWGGESALATHEHCDAGALLSWRGVALFAPAGAGAPLAFIADRISVRVLRFRSSTALYRLAPKTSPPSAAA